MKIAGIGSRETPKNILSLMTKIGAWCKKNQFSLYSGHADGADWAFEQGAQEYCTAFLPWKDFNNNLLSLSKKVIIQPTDKLIEITKEYHPAPYGLTQGVLQLMCRNACQILGEDLNSPVDVVICWTKNGRDSGGTGQAIRIAQDRKIPVVNLYWWNVRIETEKIITEEIYG